MNSLIYITNLFLVLLSKLSCVADLIVRLFVAQFFFMSGLQKFDNWETTIFLFRHEYTVPLLNPVFAAYLAASIELVLPVLLVLGLFGRFTALGLFVFNIIAVMSYSFLWTDAGHVGFMQHVYYGMLLMMLMTHGPGLLSLDKIINWPNSRK